MWKPFILSVTLVSSFIRSNPSSYHVLTPFDDAALLASPWEFGKPTFVIAHGFSGDGLEGWVVSTKTGKEEIVFEDKPFANVFFTNFILSTITWIRSPFPELLNKMDANVISVDYDKLVPAPWYNVGVSNVYKVQYIDLPARMDKCSGIYIG